MASIVTWRLRRGKAAVPRLGVGAGIPCDEIPHQAQWWQSPAFLAALVLLSALPLLWPDIPPLVDLPGHMGRYAIQTGIDHSPSLSRFYAFEWTLMGNLGVDLLVVPLAHLFGLELATKLIVLTIPPLTTIGLLWIAYEGHGRIPPTALFALPFAYNYPFMFGFVNSALSAAFALIAAALWIRFGRQGRLHARALLFVPISLCIWVTHVFGWGVLGLMAFGAEYARLREAKGTAAKAFVEAGFQCIALALPLLLMLVWRSGGVAGETGDWFNLPAKLSWLLLALHDRWRIFDIVSVAAVIFLLMEGSGKRMEAAPTLAVPAILLFLAFLLMPRILLGSAYSDMRLAPVAFAVALVSLRPARDAAPGFMRFLLVAGGIFLAVRTGANTVSLALFDRDYGRELAALDHVPRGARLVSFVGKSCDPVAASSRLDHLPALALVRREAFSNDQWDLPGAQLLRVQYPAGQPFVRDPSQLVTPSTCRPDYLSLDQALVRLPRAAFDYVWLINPPAYDSRLVQGLRPIWRSGTSVLFAVQPAGPHGRSRP